MHLWIKPYFQRPTPLQRRSILRPVRRAIHRCGRFGHHAHLSHSIPYVNPQRQFCNKAARRYKIAFYDAAIVAAALLADCDTLWSEDMHDGLVIDGRLTIRNPFAA